MEPPTRIGRYHVLGPIARGGMAEVLRVKSVGLAGFEKHLALKRIAPAQAREQRFIQSFIDEARIAAGLSHKNLVQVVDFGEVDGELYLTMELVDGCDLRVALARLAARGERMPIELAAHVVAEIASGLDYAHHKTAPSGAPLAIVHCDVSPANVMITDEGHVKILDFGVARASFTHAIERRRLRGKPRYMAPEQTRAERPTPATDVFALGVVAWELLTGVPLFEHPDVASTLIAVRTQPIASVRTRRPEVPRGLAEALGRALHRTPAARGDAAQLGRAAALAAAGTSARALAAWLAELTDDRDQLAAPTPAATVDTLVRAAVPAHLSAVPTTPLRGARTAPRLAFDDEAEATSAGDDFAWLDDPATSVDGVGILGSTDVELLDEATIDQSLDTQPPPTTRSPS